MSWNIASVSRVQARRQPEAAILEFGRERISCAELAERSNRVAQGLLELGLEPGDRIALLAKNCPEHFDVLFGAGKAGLVTVPVNWRLRSEEIGYILEDATAKVLFVGEEFAETIGRVAEELPQTRAVIVIRAGGELDGFEAWRDRNEPVDPERDVEPDEPVLQLYTSGTTGRPKGVPLSNRNLFTLLDRGEELWGLNRSSVSLVCLPLFHIGGIGWALACMRHGGKALLVRDFDPKAVLAAIEDRHVTHANFVPTMLAAIVSVSGTVQRDCSSLELVLYGTAPISETLLRDSMQTFGCRFAQVYGLTETTSAITQLDPTDHDPNGPRARVLRSAGRPYPWVESKIVNPASGAECAAGETGELWVRSPQNMKGYWRDPEATAETLTPEGWLRTGDAGYFDGDRYLFLTDRVKDMIISGGENIYPAEIEGVLAQHPSVAEVAVIGIPDEKWGETVKAVVVPEAGETVREDEIIGWARRRIAHYKCPKSIDVVDTLPRTATGKVLKRALREPYWRGRERAIN